MAQESDRDSADIRPVISFQRLHMYATESKPFRALSRSAEIPHRARGDIAFARCAHWRQRSIDLLHLFTMPTITNPKSAMRNLELDEVKANSSATGPRTVAKDDDERSARPAEIPATSKPKSNWAWAEPSGHFDWMDWHSPSALRTSTDFDL
jgi:hypothetical protein